MHVIPTNSPYSPIRKLNTNASIYFSALPHWSKLLQKDFKQMFHFMDMIEITGSLQRYIELRLMPSSMDWKDTEQKHNLW